MCQHHKTQGIRSSHGVTCGINGWLGLGFQWILMTCWWVFSMDSNGSLWLKKRKFYRFLNLGFHPFSDSKLPNGWIAGEQSKTFTKFTVQIVGGLRSLIWLTRFEIRINSTFLANIQRCGRFRSKKCLNSHEILHTANSSKEKKFLGYILIGEIMETPIS